MDKKKSLFEEMKKFQSEKQYYIVALIMVGVLGLIFPIIPVLLLIGMAIYTINIILKTILDPGDEVIILAPYFSEYIFYIHNQQGKVVVAETDEQFNLDLEELDRKITARTKAIIVNSPHNPTGRVFDKKNLMGLAMLLKDRQKKYQKDIYVISDEPYREIIFDGITISFVVAKKP